MSLFFSFESVALVPELSISLVTFGRDPDTGVRLPLHSLPTR